MEQVGDLLKLEEAVQKLMAALQNTGQDKAVMESQLQAKDQEIAALKAQLNTLQDERNQVHQRVSGLISSIDQLERQVTEGAAAHETLDDTIEKEKTLF